MQAVILDLDGLLVDSEPIHQRAFNAFLARHGISYQFENEEYGRLFVGIPVSENVKYLARRFNLGMAADDVLRERESIFQSLIEEPSNLAPMPGVKIMVEELRRRGIRTAVASGSPRLQVETMLRGLGLDAEFEVVVAGTDVERTKPAPDVYLRAVQLLGIGVDSCVAVEDSATGVAAAKGAGIRVIAVPNGYTRRQDLTQADTQVDSLERALGLIVG